MIPFEFPELLRKARDHQAVGIVLLQLSEPLKLNFGWLLLEFDSSASVEKHRS
jgi:hypothetical protein